MMKIQVLKENLHSVMTTTVKFTGNKLQVSGMEMVIFEAKGKEIWVMATDLDRAIKVRLAGKVISEGKILIPGKLMTELVSTLPLGTVELEGNESELKIKSGKMAATLQTGQDELVQQIMFEASQMVEVSYLKINDMANAWSFLGVSVSKDEARPVLTALLWEMQKGRLVATDGFRLGILSGFQKVSLERSVGESVLISGLLWQEVVRVLIDRGIDQVKVSLSKDLSRVSFEAEDVLVTGRLIQGEYPNYRAILPKQGKIVVELIPTQMLEGMRGVMLFAREAGGVVKMIFDKNMVLITANSPQLGESEVSVELQRGANEVFEIAFNGKFIMDYLHAVGGKVVQIHMNEALQPVLFTTEGNSRFEHVIMPVRLRG